MNTKSPKVIKAERKVRRTYAAALLLRGTGDRASIEQAQTAYEQACKECDAARAE